MRKVCLFIQALILCAIALSFVQKEDWVLVKTKDYTVLFPKTPIDTVIMANSAIGYLKIATHIYEVPDDQKDDNLVYILSETEYPDSVMNSTMTDKLDKFFENSAKGAVGNVHGRLISLVKTQIDGFPGREIRADIADSAYIISMRCYLVKNKLYLLEAITAIKNDYNKSISKFIGSFHLKSVKK
jgi:hypothetical protein